MPFIELIGTICLIVVILMDELRFRRLMKMNHDLAKMLASRTYTEYSHAEAQVAKANLERKPETDGYATAWESEDTTHG